jgi:hypothetical protein
MNYKVILSVISLFVIPSTSFCMKRNIDFLKSSSEESEEDYRVYPKNYAPKNILYDDIIIKNKACKPIFAHFQANEKNTSQGIYDFNTRVSIGANGKKILLLPHYNKQEKKYYIYDKSHLTVEYMHERMLNKNNENKKHIINPLAHSNKFIVHNPDEIIVNVESETKPQLVLHEHSNTLHLGAVIDNTIIDSILLNPVTFILQ